MTSSLQKSFPLCKMVVIGGSAGGIDALEQVLAELPAGYNLPIVVVIHLHSSSDTTSLSKRLTSQCRLQVSEAGHQSRPSAAQVYLAPANYHLLVEPDRSLSLSIDEKVHFSRPSIDVLFMSAAEACGDALVGVLLSGASRDGAEGLQTIKTFGGLTIVQDPETAECPYMPRSAIEIGAYDDSLSPQQIGQRLRRIGAVCKP